MNHLKRTFLAIFFIQTILFIPSVSAQTFDPILPLSKTAQPYSFSAFTLEREELVDIPFKEKRRYSNDVPVGERRITTTGVPGTKKVTEVITYDGLSVINVKVIKEEILSQPVTQIVSIGTNKKYSLVILPDGTELQYTRSLYVLATSYDHTCKGCNHITATGRYLTKGIVAVDPKVIKLGTRMYIPGYGYGEAQDTGGAIKGNRIDLAYDDIRYGDWSKRWVTIYILD